MQHIAIVSRCLSDDDNVHDDVRAEKILYFRVGDVYSWGAC